MTDAAPNLQLDIENTSLPTAQELRVIRERETAQMYLENMRERGLISAPGPTLAEQQQSLAAAALEKTQEIQPASRPYPSAEDYAEWQRDPASLNTEQHAVVCQGEQIIVGQLGELETRPCPVCQANARAADLRAKLVAAGVDGRYLDVEWGDLEQLAPLNQIAAACDDILGVLRDAECLILWSEETGTGKTQAAMLTAKAAIRAGRTAQVVNLARLAVDIRDGYGDYSGNAMKESAARQMMAAPDLLIIDDLGAGESDNASVERRLLLQVVEERQTYRRSTVITSNLRPREIAEIFGARVLARLSPLEIVHVNHGKNFRVRPGRKSRWTGGKGS